MPRPVHRLLAASVAIAAASLAPRATMAEPSPWSFSNQDVRLMMNGGGFTSPGGAGAAFGAMGTYRLGLVEMGAAVETGGSPGRFGYDSQLLVGGLGYQGSVVRVDVLGSLGQEHHSFGPDSFLDSFAEGRTLGIVGLRGGASVRLAAGQGQHAFIGLWGFAEGDFSPQAGTGRAGAMLSLGLGRSDL